MSSVLRADVSGALADVPEYQRRRVLGGMRWSVWLSCIAVPLGAIINLLLARIGPATLGVYGLLSVYVGIVTAFLYFVGDTVVIKFTPEVAAENRASFLVSYLSLILLILIPWLSFAYFCPWSVRLLLGDQGGANVNFLLLCLAPIPIAFHMVVACLKGLLEIKFSQALAKTLVLASLLAYGVVILVDRALLVNKPQMVIWGIYLGFTACLAVVGALRIWRVCQTKNIHFFLPSGFSRYCIDTQLVSAVSFVAGRLDYILLLNFGGLAVLGQYVAIMTVATGVPLINGFFMDTLLPSLTNMVAARNKAGAGQIFMMHMRILFLVTVGGCSAVMLLTGLVVDLMGPQYATLQRLIIIATLLRGIATPGPSGGTLLVSIGKQRLAVAAGCLQTIVFTVLLFSFWHFYHLAGAILANGVAAIVSGVAMMWLGRRTVDFCPSITGLWIKAAMSLTCVGLIAVWYVELRIVEVGVVWLATMTVFSFASRYKMEELQALCKVLQPGGDR
jgi:O-antigen/teichoic acid export membrane protein